MKTITLQIGNSDDKLSQRQWSNFTAAIKNCIEAYRHEMHFSGCSEAWQPWQNAVFVFSIDEKEIRKLREELKFHRSAFLQDSVAWMEGDTEFI